MEVRGTKQLYNKLLFIYTTIIAGVVAVLVLYFLWDARNRYLEQNLDYTKMMSEEAANYLKETDEVASHIHENLYKSNMELDDLLHYLRDDSQIYQQYRLNTYSESRMIEYKGVDSFIDNAFDSYEILKRVTFLSYEKGEITSYNDNRKIYHSTAGERLKSRIENGNLAEAGEFSFLKEIRDPYTMQSVGCMIFSFDGEKFSRIWQYYMRAEMVVYNGSGTVIFDSADMYEKEKLQEVDEQDELEQILHAYVEENVLRDYHILCYLDKNKAAEIPAAMILMIAGVGVILVIIGEIFIRWYLRRLSNRLNRILGGMTEVMGGQLDVRLPADKNGDELDVISLHFNEMCEKLDEHIQKQYMAEIEQKNAEMQALQSQINPHFLYNTLEAIRMKAICNGDREVGKMLYSMAVTFRSQIKEADVITLAQELHYCKKYLELFEYRYQEQFQFQVECPEEYMNVPIIKFVLQPVIENYFIHGMRKGEKDNLIRIVVSKNEEEYQIVVEDNGRGMSIDEIEEKNRELEANEMKKNASIGITNVNRRIKAVYGKKYGIRIEENPGGGLRVILRFKSDERE